MNRTNFSNNCSNLTNHTFQFGNESETVSLYLSTTETFCLVIFLAFFGCVGFVQNLVVILSIAFTKDIPESPVNIFLMSLACSDFLLCGVTAPLLIYNCYHWIFNDFVTVSKFIVVATTGSIFLMTVNRFVSIVRPLRYPKTITKGRAVFMVGCVWLAATTFPMLAIIGFTYNVKSICHITRYLLVFYITSSSGMYVYMYTLARKHRLLLDKLKYAVSGQMNASCGDFKALRSLFMVAGSFVACWLPMTIAFFLADREKLSGPDFYLCRIFSYTAPLAVVNTVLDPTIHYYRGKGFLFSVRTLAKRF